MSDNEGGYMNNDLKIIKKKYGEEMMHLCRDLFPTLLEKEGLLPSLLLHSFHESHSLAQDIISEQLEYEFKSYIYQQVDVNDVENNKITKIVPTTEMYFSIFRSPTFIFSTISTLLCRIVFLLQKKLVLDNINTSIFMINIQFFKIQIIIIILKRFYV